MSSVDTIEPDQTRYPAGPAPQTRSQVRRRAGLGAAALLLAGAGVIGGLAVGAPGTTAAGPTTQSRATTPSGASGSGFPGAGALAPRFDQGTGNGSASGAAYDQETATDATASQSVGLVEITSTLTNGTGAGTGLILSSGGTVVTNHHVVAGAVSVKVTVVSTGATYDATYIGGDATTDVAVLKLDGASGLTPVTIASTAASADESVTAVGDAGGDGGSLTASPGTVAALDQDITVQEDDGSTADLTGLIQLAAYVVPGDSGGAVLDSAGQVVGMNVAASTGSRTVTGYAIPIATVESVVDRVLAGDASSTVALGYDGYLGVGLDPSTTTPLVTAVLDGGPAATAGIEAGATITNLDGTAITSSGQLRRLLAAKDPGDRVTVAWITSAGAHHATTVTLGRAPIA